MVERSLGTTLQRREVGVDVGLRPGDWNQHAVVNGLSPQSALHDAHSPHRKRPLRVVPAELSPDGSGNGFGCVVRVQKNGELQGVMGQEGFGISSRLNGGG